MAIELFEDMGYSEETRSASGQCIVAQRYRNTVKPQTIEAQILSDAGQREALGLGGLPAS